jgi:hypothetical protein
MPRGASVGAMGNRKGKEKRSEDNGGVEGAPRPPLTAFAKPVAMGPELRDACRISLSKEEHDLLA